MLLAKIKRSYLVVLHSDIRYFSVSVCFCDIYLVAERDTSQKFSDHHLVDVVWS